MHCSRTKPVCPQACVVAVACQEKLICAGQCSGVTVSPMNVAVSLALGEAVAMISSSYMGTGAVNGNLLTLWPLTMVNYALLLLNLTTLDCTFIQGFLAFLGWTQLNNCAVTQAMLLGYMPLPFGYKMYAVPLHLCVPSIMCCWCISPYWTPGLFHR